MHLFSKVMESLLNTLICETFSRGMILGTPERNAKRTAVFCHSNIDVRDLCFIRLESNSVGSVCILNVRFSTVGSSEGVPERPVLPPKADIHIRAGARWLIAPHH